MRERVDDQASRSTPRKATGWILLAALTCPCHLPLLAILLSGTAAGAWLADNTALGLTVLAVLFGLALAGAWRRIGRPAP